jgi:transcription elongation factor SPT5
MNQPGGGAFGRPSLNKGAFGGGGGGSGGGGSGGAGGKRDVDELANQAVFVTGGPWKGYRGVVKQATPTLCRVMLDSTLKTVNVARIMVISVDAPELRAGNMGSRGAPPSGVGFTPAHRGSMTPARSLPPSTPSHTSSSRDNDPWDPAGLQSRSVPTPFGTQEIPTPATTRADYMPPNTMGYPGSAYPPSSVYPPNTTQANFYPAQTPGGAFGAPTPGTTQFGGVAATPGSAYPYAAQTPAVPGTVVPGMMQPPPTSMMGPPPTAASSGPLWRIPGAEVARGGAEQPLGVLLAIEGDRAVVRVGEAGETQTIPVAELTQVAVRKRDRVRIMDGENTGQTGQLIGIDGNDAIVKLDRDLDIKIVVLSQIVRWKGLD